MDRRLTRSTSDVVIAGVCSGLGQYLGIDAWIVRLFFLLLALGNGIGVFIYLLLWFIVPREGEARDATMGENVRTGADEIAAHVRSMGDELRQSVNRPNQQVGLLLGAALILVGVYFLLQNLNVYWLRWLKFDLLWPVLLIIGGVVLLVRLRR